MKPLFQSLLLVGALLSARAALATAWVERHDLTGADYQTEFNRWTAAPYSMRPVCVSGYEVGGQARYAAIFEKVSGPAWSASHGMTTAQFNSLNATMTAQNYWPVFISGFTIGGIPYYNAVWENYRYPFGSVVAKVGLTSAGLTSETLTWISQGYALAYVSTFTSGGIPMYAAVWSKNVSSSSVQCGYGMTDTAYQTQFNNMAGQGFRLVANTVSLEGTTERYAAVWKKPFGTGWYSYPGISESNFRGETLNAYYTGYRPTFVSVYTKNNQSLYNAVWTYNGGLTPGQAAPIYNTINSYMSSNNVPGLSLSISRNGRLVFAKGFGLADMANNEWVHPKHRFRIASVSKPITATTMMHLRDAGFLTATSNKVFGAGALLGTTYGTQAYSANEKAITVTHLLSHTTGWTNDGQLWNNAYGANHPAIIGWQLDNANQFMPGTRYQYMNMDYCVAGRVIERLTGTNYEGYIRKYILGSCGITDMELGNQALAGRKANEVVYYASSPGAGDPYVVIDPHRMDANGGWIAKPNDLLLFMRRIDGRSLNTDIISSDRLNEMLTPPPAAGSYGLGLFGVPGGYGHNGCMSGTRSFLVHRYDGFDYAVVLNIDVPSDSCTWNLRQGIDAAISSISTNAWPDYDLFDSVNPEYDAWAAQAFPSYLRAQPGLKQDFWGPEADADADGLKNLFEAYFDFNPLVANANPFQHLVDNGNFVVRWILPLFSSQHGVELASEFKANLNAAMWQAGPAVQLGPVAGALETRTPLAARPHQFQRFTATAP
jgi:CubicO group peptidase (beta-lactamase class C family)